MKKKFLLLLNLLWACSSFAFQQIDGDTYFPAVVQGHRGDASTGCVTGSGGRLEQNGNARINGTQGADLRFCSSNSSPILSMATLTAYSVVRFRLSKASSCLRVVCR